MKSALIIGDSHLKISRLEDARAYTQKLLTVVRELQPDYAILLGDQTDTFAVLRSEILALWNEFVSGAQGSTQLILMVGNHDLSGADGGNHSMEVFRDRATVVDKHAIVGGVHFLPFMRETKEFEAICKTIPEGSLLFVHQSFNGAMFENGFYDPHGADPECVSHLKQVVSGHIHKAQKINNIWYPGTPYQMTFSDSGESKFVHYCQIGDGQLENINQLPLDMPEFIVLKAKTIPELLESLPEPIAQNHYKFASEGTLQEIEAFEKDERIISFKSKVRRAENALVSKRTDVTLMKVEGETLQERLTAFIKSKEWKSEHGRIIEHANRLLA